MLTKSPCAMLLLPARGEGGKAMGVHPPNSSAGRERESGGGEVAKGSELNWCCMGPKRGIGERTRLLEQKAAG